MEIERLEEQLKGAFDAYEICLISERMRAFEAADRDLYGREFSEEEGIALRAVKNNQAVFSYTFERGDGAVPALLENTKALLPFMQVDPNCRFPAPFAQYPQMDHLYDETGVSVPEDKKIATLLSMEGTILDFDPRIKKTRSCELHENEITVKIVNSNGLKAEARKTIYMMAALCVAADREEVSWYDWSWSPRLDGLDGRALGLKIAEKAVSLLGGETLATGVYDGCLTPAAACDLLSLFSSSFLGENLDKDKTRLKGKEGSRLFSEPISIIDSGIIGMGSFPFDGEGVSSRENCLVRDGVLQGFLFDGYYGAKTGHPSTGNSVRTGIKEPPRNGARGFYIEAGKTNLSKLEQGIIIEELMGTHTANPVTGDFSLGALGYIWKGGEKKPFKGVMVSGNIFDLFNDIKAVGNDLTFYGTVGSPTLFVEGFKISGT